MSKYYYSFGQSHTHRVRGVTLDCDSIVEVIVPDDDDRGMELARAKMFDEFGQKWSMQYTEDTLDISFFPRGVVLCYDLRPVDDGADHSWPEDGSEP